MIFLILHYSWVLLLSSFSYAFGLNKHYNSWEQLLYTTADCLACTKNNTRLLVAGPGKLRYQAFGDFWVLIKFKTRLKTVKVFRNQGPFCHLYVDDHSLHYRQHRKCRTSANCALTVWPAMCTVLGLRWRCSTNIQWMNTECEDIKYLWKWQTLSLMWLILCMKWIWGKKIRRLH